MVRSYDDDVSFHCAIALGEVLLLKYGLKALLNLIRALQLLVDLWHFKFIQIILQIAFSIFEVYLQLLQAD